MLITGSHRSGTTWVGKVINESDVFLYYEEPMNIEKTKDRLGTFKYFFQYIDPDDEGLLEGLIKLKVNAEDNKKRALYKDPIAFFSIDAFINKINADVLLLVRHPAAFVSSLKRLNWNFDFNHFIKQDYLMETYLHPFRDEIKAYAIKQPALIEQATLLWNIFYLNALKYREKYPDLYIVRHEDLSSGPREEFMKIFARFNIPYTSDVDKYINKTTSIQNPSESINNEIHTLNRNSKKLVGVYTQRLDIDEINYIRNKTAYVAHCFYDDSDWQC